MGHCVWILFCGFIFLTPTIHCAENKERIPDGKIIQILLEKNISGKEIPMLIDTQGQKVALTLGSLLNAAAEAFTKKAAEYPLVIDPNTVVFIRLEQDEKGKIVSKLMRKNGNIERLNFGNLLAEAASKYPGCTAAKIDGQNVKIILHFEKDADDNIQAYLNSGRGKEEFNLGVMFREVILLLNQCQQLF